MLPQKNNQDLTTLKNQFYNTFSEDLHHVSGDDKIALVNTYITLIRTGKGVEVAKAKLAYQLTLEKYNELPAKSFGDCFAETSPALSTLVKYRGRTFTLIFIQAQFSKLMRAFDAKYGMDEETIRELAEDFLEDYFYFRVSDLKFFIRKAKRKEFGENFSNLSLATILGWVAIYAESRFQKTSRLEQKKKAARNAKEMMSREEMAELHRKLKKGEVEITPKVKKEEPVKKGYKEKFAEFKKDKLMMDYLKGEYKLDLEAKRTKAKTFDEYSLNRFLIMFKS